MKKFWKSKKGSVSLFLLILLTAIFFFNAVLIDYARIWAARLQADRAMSAATRSVLSNYDRELQEKYGLYGTNIFSDVSMKSLLDGVVNKNIDVPEGSSTDYLNLKLDNSTLNEDDSQTHTLADRNIFTMQVLDDMKYKGPVEFSLAMLTPLSEMAGKLKKSSSETKALDSMDKDNETIQNAVDKLKKSMDEIQSSYNSTSLAPQFVDYVIKQGFHFNYSTKLPIAPVVQYVLVYMRAQIYVTYLKKVEEADTDNLADVANDPDLLEQINTYKGMYLIAKSWIEDAGTTFGDINNKFKTLTASGGDLDKAIEASKRIDDYNSGGDPYNSHSNDQTYDNVTNEANSKKKDASAIIGDKLKGSVFGSCSSCGQSLNEAKQKLDQIMNKKKQETVSNGGVSRMTEKLQSLKSLLNEAKTAAGSLKTQADYWKAPIVDGGKPVQEGQEPFNFSGSKESLEKAISDAEKKIATLLQSANPVDFKIEDASADTFDAQKLKDYASFLQLMTFTVGFENNYDKAMDVINDLKNESDEARSTKAEVMSTYKSVSNCFDDLFNLGQFASSTANYQEYVSKYEKMKGYHDKFASTPSSVSLKEIDESDNPVEIAKGGGDTIDEEMASISGNLDAGDNLLINEYTLLRMKAGDLAKTDYATYNLLFDEEVEYVIHGSYTPGNNYKALMMYTYFIRLGLNFAYMMVDKEYAAIRAIPFGIGYLILLVMAIFDSFMDMACLKQGDRVPLWKGFDELGWKYKDYLRFFLTTQTNYEEKINRLMSIIQVKDPRFDLYTKYTQIDADVKFSIKLWFLPQVMKMLSYSGAIGGSINGKRYVFERRTGLSY